MNVKGERNLDKVLFEKAAGPANSRKDEASLPAVFAPCVKTEDKCCLRPRINRSNRVSSD